MKVITIKYQSDDGKMHDTEEACKLQNAKLAVAPSVLTLLGEANLKTNQDVAQWVGQHASELHAILTPAQPKKARAPRKTSKAADTGSIQGSTDCEPSICAVDTNTQAANDDVSTIEAPSVGG